MPEHQRMPTVINNSSIAFPSELTDFYQECNSSFQRYFGVVIKPGFVKEISLDISDPTCQDIGGSYNPATKSIILFPGSKNPRLLELTRKLDKPWQGPLSHEIGHALLFQWKDSDFWTALRARFSPYGWNRAAHEAFANLAMIAHNANGNSQEVTQILSDILTPKSLLFSPDRIADYYVLGGIKYEDTAILHYLHLKFGSSVLRKTVLAPRGFIAGGFLDPMMEMRMKMEDYGVSKVWIGDRWFNEYNSWLIKNTHMNSAELSQEAYKWYRREIPSLVN